MSIIRLIHIKIDPSETETAERIWKTMGDGGRHRALHEQRSPQADRQPHAQREGRQRRGQAV